MTDVCGVCAILMYNEAKLVGCRVYVLVAARQRDGCLTDTMGDDRRDDRCERENRCEWSRAATVKAGVIISYPNT